MPLVPVLSQLCRVHPLPSCLCKIHFNVILLFVPIPYKWSVSFRFPDQNLVCISVVLVCATCPILFILLLLVTSVTFGEKYRAWSSSLCIILHMTEEGGQWKECCGTAEETGVM